MAEAGREGHFVQNLLMEVLDRPVSLELYNDATSAIATTQKCGPGRMKHLELRALYLQDEVRAGRLRVIHIGSASNPADLLTKPVQIKVLQRLSAAFGLQLGGPAEASDAALGAESGLVMAILPRTLTVPRHCRRNMRMVVGTDGRVYWRCVACDLAQTWGQFLAAAGASGSQASVAAYSGLDITVDTVTESASASSSAAASTSAAAAGSATPTVMTGGGAQVHVHVGGPMPSTETSPSEPAASGPAPAKATSAKAAPSKPAPAKAAPAKAKAKPVSGHVPSPPTQRQIDYIEILCGQHGLDFHTEMANIHTKGEASRWISAHVQSG